MGRHIDLTGQVFGRLTVVGRATQRPSYWSCVCVCGVPKDVHRSNLRNGNTTSCGCYHKERVTQHGAYNTRLYNIWVNMVQRCENPRKDSYKNYGGRGIFICPEWRNDFRVFREWAITHGYDATLTIDRIDVNRSYEPNNCRWATPKQQQENRRTKPVVRDNTELFPDAVAAAHASNIGPNSIRRAIRGERHSAGGHKWRHATKEEIDIIVEMKRGTI